MSNIRSMTVQIEKAGRDLAHLLEGLSLRETITLVSSEGTPLAVVVSLKPIAPESATQPASDWMVQWKALAEEIGRAWKSEKSAVEVLSEMRR